jgi:hypothetical protein
MEAARASTAGHLSPAFSALSEIHTAYTTGHGIFTSGVFLFVSPSGTSSSLSSFIPLRLLHHTPRVTPSGVIFHNMFNTAAASQST